MPLTKQIQKARRQRRVRAKIHGSASRPRISVFRSNKHIYAQLIDDDAGKILALASDFSLKGKNVPMHQRAKEIGKVLGKSALDQKITSAVFDRGGYKYHGNVKAVAEGAREAGLQF